MLHDDQSPHSDYVLYLFMRNDMSSLNAGKACAQAHHAACRLLQAFGTRNDVMKWQNQTSYGYGTVLVFAADIDTIQAICTSSGSRSALPSGLMHDPTYPVRDGQVTHLIPLVTCGYVLAPKDYAYIRQALDEYRLELMP